jgi:hypothetical protein
MGLMNKRGVLVFLLLAALIPVSAYFASFLPNADWYGTYDPAARGIFSGQSPYAVAGFHNPPWALLLLFPFIVFSPEYARGLFFVASILAFVVIVWKVKINPLAAIALFLSPTMIGGLLACNLDTFVLAGVLFPPAWGLFILLIKPQVGMGVALYYLHDSWKKGGWSKVLWTFAPVALGYSLSFLIFPVLVEKFMSKSSIDPWNRSIFPYGVPLGLFFLWLAIRRKNAYFALAVAPLISPYITFYSYLAVQVALMHEDVERVIRRDVLQILLTVFLWAVMLTFHL